MFFSVILLFFALCFPFFQPQKQFGSCHLPFATGPHGGERCIRLGSLAAPGRVVDATAQQRPGTVEQKQFVAWFLVVFWCFLVEV